MVYTEAFKAEVRAARAAGQTWNAIAESHGLNVRTLKDRFETFDADRRNGKPPTVERRCMTCPSMIQSEGFHHRRCVRCRAREESRYEPETIGDIADCDVPSMGGVRSPVSFLFGTGTPGRRRLSPEDHEAVKRDSRPAEQIAEDYGVTPAQVYRIKRQ